MQALVDGLSLRQVERVLTRLGEWLGFDFNHESLNFTAEFVGPVKPPPPVLIYEADDPVSIRPGVVVSVIIEKKRRDWPCTTT